MLRRVARLYPLFFLGLSLSALQVFLTGCFGLPHYSRGLTLVDYGLGILFLPTPTLLSIGAPGIFPLNGPAWSLSIELVANFFYAATHRFYKPRTLVLVTGTFGVWLIYYACHYDLLDAGSTWQTYGGGCTRVAWSFLLGVGLSRLHWTCKLGQIRAWWSVVLGYVLLLIFLSPATSIGFDLLCVTILLPGVVFIGAHVRAPAGLAKKTSDILGTSSYALYATHIVLLNWFDMVSKIFGLDLYGHPFRNICVLTITAIVVAIMLDTTYDIPARRKLTSLLAALDRRPKNNQKSPVG